MQSKFHRYIHGTHVISNNGLLNSLEIQRKKKKRIFYTKFMIIFKKISPSSMLNTQLSISCKRH